MIEFWQAGLLSLASLLVGGVVGLLTSYFQRRWTLSDVREAEERDAARRVHEEERRATRDYRRERIRPIEDFLRLAKRAVAAKSSQPMLRKASGLSEEAAKAGLGDEFEPLQFGGAFATAAASVAHEEIDAALETVMYAVITHQQEDAKGEDPYQAIVFAEDLVERYLVEVKV